MSSGIAKRVLSIWLPRWSVNLAERRVEGGAREPLATVEAQKGALRLHRVNEVAAEHGLTAGMALTDARGICPTLLTRERCAPQEHTALRALHRWSQRFTPWAAIDDDDGLTLDITGCAHLFGGEEQMLKRIEAELSGFGLAHRRVVADSRGAAMLAARYGTADQLIIPPGRTRAYLGGLSVNALGKDRFALRRLGLKTLGDVAALPRAELTKRFGIALAQRLEEAFGLRPVPVAPMRIAPTFRVRMSFPEPIGLRSYIDTALQMCLDRLCVKIAEAGRGAREVSLHLIGSDGARQRLSVGLARPGQHARPIARQFAPLLDKVDVGFGLDALRVVVDAHEAHQPHQPGMDRQAGEEPLLDLVGRLGNRFGFDRITRPCPVESHLPERQCRHTPFTEVRQRIIWPDALNPAPVRVHTHAPMTAQAAGRAPDRVTWKGQPQDILHTNGPCRFGGEWWQNESRLRRSRDYWQAQTQTGERLWLRCDLGPDELREWRVEGVLP